jgi:hypothetical protein
MFALPKWLTDIKALLPTATSKFLRRSAGNAWEFVTVDKTLVGLSNVTNAAQVKKAALSTNNMVPKWSGTTGDVIVDGYAVGTAANNLVQLDGSAKLPAVDGSQLTNVTASNGLPDYVYQNMGVI